MPSTEVPIEGGLCDLIAVSFWAGSGLARSGRVSLTLGPARIPDATRFESLSTVRDGLPHNGGGGKER